VISPDSTRVVFSSASLLYSVPVDGSASAVALTNVSGLEVVLDNFQITPDSQRVVFPGGNWDDKGTFPVVGLHSVPIDASAAPIELMPRVDSGDFSGISFAIMPNSERVVALYQANSQLYGTRVDGSEPVAHLNDVGFANQVKHFDLGPAGLVAFTAQAGAQHALCTVLLIDDPSPALPLVVTSSPAYVSNPEVAPSGRVLYAYNTTGTAALYSIPFDGSAPPVELSGPMVPGGGVQGVGAFSVPGAYWIDPSGQHVVYRADQETDEVSELFCARIAGGVPAVKLSGPMVAGGDVWAGADPFVQFVPGTRRIVYKADQETDNTNELFTSAHPTFGPRFARAPLPEAK
jgi:hypothetical protein